MKRKIKIKILESSLSYNNTGTRISVMTINPCIKFLNNPAMSLNSGFFQELSSVALEYLLTLHNLLF